MEPWINIEYGEISELPDAAPNGVRVRYTVSPYDTPEAIRGFRTDDRKHFVIEFRYLDSEPTEERSVNGAVVRVGRASGRVYSIRVPLKHPESDVALDINESKEVVAELDSALSSYNKSASKATASIDAVKRALTQKRPQLLASISS